MNKMKHFLLLLFALGFVACGSKKETKQTEEIAKPVVSVINYPLYYFAQRIGGDLIDLKYPIPTDVDPAYWVPISESLTVYQESDLVFVNGANYAKWIKNVSLPQRILVNTSAEAKEKYIEVQEGVAHSHGDGEEHVHTGLAFTTWLDFEMAIIQARAIKNSLVKLMPESEQQLGSNFTVLEKDLLELHTKMKAIHTHETIIGSHPVYQYLAKAYHIHIHSVHFEPNEMPSHDQWHELDHLLHHHPSSLIIWEDEPIEEIKTKLEEKGIKTLVFNPCGNKPKEGDFMDVMKKNITALENKINAD